MTVYTTLNKISAFKPSKSFWEELLDSLGKTQADDEPLALVSILDNNGLNDAIRCTRTVFDEHRDKIVRFAIGCAENVLPVFEKARPNDLRPRQAIQAAKDYLEGKITKADLNEAAEAAEAAKTTDAAVWIAEAACAAESAKTAALMLLIWTAAWTTNPAAWTADAAVWTAMVAVMTTVLAADAVAMDAELKFQEDLFRKIFGEGAVMNTNNPKRFSWEAEASGTKPTLMQAGVEMIKADQNAQEAANNLQNWVDTMLPNKHSGYSDYLMSDNKVFERKRSNLGLCFAVAVAMILGSIIALL